MNSNVSAHNLARSFGKEQALSNVSFEAVQGEVVALLGPNGAGKTTTVRILNGALTPDSGKAQVLGMDPVTHGPDIRARTGVLTENSALDDRLTALENITFHARIRGMSRGDSAKRGIELLEQLGMADRTHSVVQGFSTGQKKRVSLARSLIHRPDVLFLDEPTSGLDPQATRDVLDLLAGEAREDGRTVLLATHFLPEAGRLANRMAVMNKGTVLAFGTTEQIAAEFWDGFPVTFNFGTDTENQQKAQKVVHDFCGTPTESDSDNEHNKVRLHHRDQIPALLNALVNENINVYGANVEEYTLEDVYFAVMNAHVPTSTIDLEGALS